MAVRIADTLKQQNNLTTFPVAYGEDIWLDENKGSGTANYDSLQNLYNDGKLGGSSIQVTIMPNASETYLDTVLLYIGETGTYKYGTYYKCISDGETPPTYSWVDAEIGGGTKIFYGTMDEWDALSTDAKKQYDYMSDEQTGSEDNGEWKTAWTGSVSLPSTDGQETTIISGLSIANAKRIAIKLGSNQGNRIPDIAIVEHLIGVTNIGSASVCYLGDAEYYCCASFKVDFSNGTIRGNFISYKWAFTNTVVGVYWQ